MNGFWARLQQQNVLSVWQVCIDRPFDVLWRAVVFFSPLGQLCNGSQLVVGQTADCSTLGVYFPFDQTVDGRIRDQFNVFFANVFGDDVQGDFVELDIVWRDRTGYDGFTNAIRCIHGDFGTIPIG